MRDDGARVQARRCSVSSATKSNATNATDLHGRSRARGPAEKRSNRRRCDHSELLRTDGVAFASDHWDAAVMPTAGAGCAFHMHTGHMMASRSKSIRHHPARRGVNSNYRKRSSHRTCSLPSWPVVCQGTDLWRPKKVKHRRRAPPKEVTLAQNLSWCLRPYGRSLFLPTIVYERIYSRQVRISHLGF